ncbi:MAG: hypothetical protein K2H81_03425 [Alistipes sp.]|nr:hypothetical protein [Alistipes sp.]
MKQLFCYILYIGIFFLSAGCGKKNYGLRSGDLIFQVGAAGGMTEAIQQATSGNRPDDTFTHVGIIWRQQGKISVIEAKSAPGVTITPLEQFLQVSQTREGKPIAIVARLNTPAARKVAEKAVARALKKVGCPYDDTFLPGNDMFYCSELVWETFLDRNDSTRLFPAAPMNFKDDKGCFPQYWIEHFDRLHMPVPQDTLGTNPNKMAQESCLTVVFDFSR